MAALALFQHYLEYLSSPGLLLTIFILVVPIVFSVAVEKRLAPQTPEDEVPNCRRLGLHIRSNFEDQFRPSPAAAKRKPRVKALFTYPVKSCRGVELAASEVEACGLKYDRLFTFAQLVSRPDKAGADGESTERSDDEPTHQWRFITQREFPRLALLKTQLWLPDTRGRERSAKTSKTAPANGDVSKNDSTSPSQPRVRSRTRGNTLVGQLERGSGGKKGADLPEVSDWAANGGGLIVRFPFEPDFNPLGLRTEYITLKLPLMPTFQRAEAKRYGQEELIIWKDRMQAVNVSNEIDPKALAKLRYFLGVSNPLALFRVDEQHRRSVDRCLPKEKAKDGYQVGFPDAFPVNLLSMASVRAVDDDLPDEDKVKGKLDARRFRANIYITGVPAFAEDSWKSITIGHRLARTPQGLFEIDAEYHVACRCARCKLPNVDPDVGEKDRNEPSTTLAKTRKVDEGALPHPCLGMQMIPLFQRGLIKVGDEIKVIETGEHSYEKMFP